MFRKMQKKDFDEVFAIMDESFPTDELRPYEEQKALINKDNYTIYVESVDNSISAFFAVWDFDTFAFIEHFAVREKYRNGGRGSRLLTHLVETLGKKVILEVEPPVLELATRRVGFYKRNGFCLNEYNYTQPPISHGKTAIKLLLMTYPDTISADEYIKIKTLLHTVVYSSEVLD